MAPKNNIIYMFDKIKSFDRWNKNYSIIENSDTENSSKLDKAILQISEKFPKEKVSEMIEKEIKEWADPSWEKDYRSEKEWYKDHNNGEAEDIVFTYMINWYEKTNNINLSDNESIELFNRLEKLY